MHNKLSQGNLTTKMATASASIIPNTLAKTEVWEHFGYPGTESGGILTRMKIICRHCKNEMPYKNNTTNMYVHLDHHHKEVYMKMSLQTTTKNLNCSKESKSPTFTTGNDEEDAISQ